MARGERSMVPEAEFGSYYGRPILKQPTWKTPDVPLYLFLGGMGGASALLAEGAVLADLPGLELVARSVAGGSAMVGTVYLIHDLGRPERFLNMLRVFKPTSPLSVGSYILAPFATFSSAALASHVTGLFPPLGRLAGLGAAAFGPPLATYTAALFANTAIPVWHEAYRELPFLFAASGASAGGGIAMALAPSDQVAPAVRMAVAGAGLELAVDEYMQRHLGMLAEPYEKGLTGRLHRTARASTAAGLVLTALGSTARGRRRPWVRRVTGAAYVAGSVLTRFAVFEAGKESARDPKYVVIPQRERVRAREAAAEAEAARAEAAPA